MLARIGSGPLCSDRAEQPSNFFFLSLHPPLCSPFLPSRQTRRRPSEERQKGRLAAIWTENLDKFTFLVLTSFVFNRVERAANVQRTSRRTHTRALLLAAHARTLNVLSTFFPHFSSHATSLTTPAASSHSLPTGIRPNPCAISIGDGLLGRSDPKHTGYEPKFCSDVSSEHMSNRNISFQQEYDATINHRF